MRGTLGLEDPAASLGRARVVVKCLLLFAGKIWVGKGGVQVLCFPPDTTLKYCQGRNCWGGAQMFLLKDFY